VGVVPQKELQRVGGGEGGWVSRGRCGLFGVRGRGGSVASFRGGLRSVGFKLWSNLGWWIYDHTLFRCGGPVE